MIFKLPELPYKYDSLEPYIDKETMKIHHLKHHGTYVNNVNNILKDNNITKFDENEILMNLKDFKLDIRTILQNNIGGHVNHSFFWKQFTKNSSKILNEFKLVINKTFGSVEDFQSKFTNAALSKFGSGWVWLVFQNNCLCIQTTSNQDNPLMGKDIVNVYGIPIIGLDLWEHAYYLKYRNNKIQYINAFWKILNWNYVSELFLNTI